MQIRPTDKRRIEPIQPISPIPQPRREPQGRNPHPDDKKTGYKPRKPPMDYHPGSNVDYHA